MPYKFPIPSDLLMMSLMTTSSASLATTTYSSLNLQTQRPWLESERAIYLLLDEQHLLPEAPRTIAIATAIAARSVAGVAARVEIDRVRAARKWRRGRARVRRRRMRARLVFPWSFLLCVINCNYLSIRLLNSCSLLLKTNDSIGSFHCINSYQSYRT